MFVESLKSTGLGLVKDLQNTVANILKYLKESKLVAGKGIRLDKTPNGIVITATATGGGSTIIQGGGGGSEPVEIIKRNAVYYNNVCRLSTDGAVSSFCMDFNATSGASLFNGNFQYNVNGLYNYIPSAMTALSTITSGIPRMNSTRTWEIGLQFDLTMTEIPSAQVFNSYKSPYYWEWNVAMQSREVRLNRNNIPSSGTLSSHFIPVAYLSLSSTQPYSAGIYDAVLENVNQYPALMTQIDPAFVRMVDSYTPPPDGN